MQGPRAEKDRIAQKEMAWSYNLADWKVRRATPFNIKHVGIRPL